MTDAKRFPSRVAIGTRTALAVRRRTSILVGLLLCAAGTGETSSAVAATRPISVRGYLYEIKFKGTGTEHVTDSDGQNGAETQDANWVVQPPPVRMWLPKYNGPPGVTRKLQVSAQEVTNPAGKVTERGTYPDQSSDGTPIGVPYSCSGDVQASPMHPLFTVDNGPYSPDPAIQTDFAGVFSADGSHCDTNPELRYAPQKVATFEYTWFPAGTFGSTSDSGTMMAVGTLIASRDIGLSSFSLVAQDYNHVNATNACRYTSIGQGCTLAFHLGGEYELTLICGGSITFSSGGPAAGACGKGGTGGTGSDNGKNGKNGKNGRCSVPSLVGKTLATAVQALRTAHCALGKVTTRRPPNPASIGHVLSQAPRPGRKLKKGAKVSVVVAT